MTPPSEILEAEIPPARSAAAPFPETEHPEPESPDWDRLRNRPLSLEEKRRLREFYGAHYPVKSNYTNLHPFNRVISLFRVWITHRVFGELGKVLDAGCSAGGEVLAFRQAGVDAWGFDLCPELKDVCFDPVRPYLRIGSVDHIPFSREDGFTTLISYDVLEHVPVDELEGFPRELERLGVRNISCVIAKDTISEGHITIQETSWWLELFGRAGFELVPGIPELFATLPVPDRWEESERAVRFAPYPMTGVPRNGWNTVPGHLFLRKRS